MCAPEQVTCLSLKTGTLLGRVVSGSDARINRAALQVAAIALKANIGMPTRSAF